MTPAQFTTAREQAGITQAELGALLGRSERQVRRWEDGDTPINRALVIAIEQVLKVGNQPATKRKTITARR